jgi:acyl carrier protein
MTDIDDIERKLDEAFAAVFPALTLAEIRAASIRSVAEWDSMETLTLIAIIEESYDLVISVEDLEDLTSYDLIRDYLTRSLVGTA